MELKTRSTKSLANIAASFLNKIITLVIKFVVRTVFIFTLSEEYLGINGLFTSIISLLSLADLGFGIALPFSLYKPLAKNDKNKIKKIINFYGKVYTIVGIAVLIIGVSLTPFLPFIIKELPNIKHITFIYLLFVINSSVSYFLIYKRTLIIADQKGYIVTYIESGFSLVIALIQIIVLLIFRNYILYLMSGIFITILQNIYISYKADKLYPYIKQKNNPKLESSEVNILVKNIFALFIYKLAIVIETGIDNVIISSFVGIASVGLYSNYLLIIDSLKSILMITFNSLTASIGNVAVSEKSEKAYLIYKSINLLSIILYGTTAIAMWILINPFIMFWAGDNYLLDFLVVSLLCINYYIFGSQNTTSLFRNAFGLFWEGRYRPVIMTITNILFSILFVKHIGLAGVFLGTIISRLMSVSIIDPYILHKYAFKLPVIPYYLEKIKYGIIVLIVGIFTKWATSFIQVNNLLLWFIKGFTVCIVSIMFFLIIFWRKEELQYIVKSIKEIFTRKLKKT